MCTQNPSHLNDDLKQKEFAYISGRFVYPSWIMKNALTSLVNLVTLMLGIAIGVLIAPYFEKRAQAYALQQRPQSAQTTPPSLASSGQPAARPEQITPGMTMGSFASYLVLTHHLQTDELIVNGIDMLKLQEGELQLLSEIQGISQQRVQGIVNNAKDTRLYQAVSPNEAGPQR